MIVGLSVTQAIQIVGRKTRQNVSDLYGDDQQNVLLGKMTYRLNY